MTARLFIIFHFFLPGLFALNGFRSKIFQTKRFWLKICAANWTATYRPYVCSSMMIEMLRKAIQSFSAWPNLLQWNSSSLCDCWTATVQSLFNEQRPWGVCITEQYCRKLILCDRPVRISNFKSVPGLPDLKYELHMFKRVESFESFGTIVTISPGA